jgi:hypothetical protein
MAFGLGFNLTEAGQGAQGLSNIMTAQSSTAATNAKNQYDTKRFGALSDYMDKSKAQASDPSTAAGGLSDAVNGPTGDLATQQGKEVYGILQMQQQLQKDRAAVDAEEKSISGLAPEDKNSREATLARKQSNIDRTELKLLTESGKQLGQTYSILDAVKTPQDWAAANTYLQKQYSSLADEAGLKDPQQKQKFIDDHIEKTIGKSYNPKEIEIKKMGMVDLQDQLKMKMIDRQMKALDKQTLALEISSKRQARAAAAKLAQENYKGYQIGLVDAEQNIRENTASLKELDENAKQLSTQTPPKKIGGVFGIGSQENPEYLNHQKQLEDNQKTRDGIRADIENTKKQRDLFLAKLKEKVNITDDGDILETPAKPEEVKKTDLSLDKYDSSISGKSSSQVFSEYQKAYPKATPKEILDAAIKNGDLKGK